MRRNDQGEHRHVTRCEPEGPNGQGRQSPEATEQDRKRGGGRRVGEKTPGVVPRFGPEWLPK
jgi:hypothetical protein